MQEFQSGDVSLFYRASGQDIARDCEANLKGQNNADIPVVIWAHGWGHSHHAMGQLSTPFERGAHHISLDFPGFGISPAPPESWGTEEYADFIAEFIRHKKYPPVIWVGHSFGCRVGAQIAAKHPDLIASMVFISGAGLKKKRSLGKKVYLFLRIRLFKFLRRFVPEGALKDKIMCAFGSRDYNSSGAMRSIFVRVVNEDLSDKAKHIQCPVTLIYGANDEETPPEFGKRYAEIIQHSTLHILDGQDHYSVLDDGRHQVVKILHDVIKKAQEKSAHD